MSQKIKKVTTVTKTHLVQALHEHADFSKKGAHLFVDCLFGGVRKALLRGEEVKITGFGSFYGRLKKPRLGRNPQTGEPLKIQERRAISFKLSQVLRERIDQVERSFKTLKGREQVASFRGKTGHKL